MTISFKSKPVAEACSAWHNLDADGKAESITISRPGHVPLIIPIDEAHRLGEYLQKESN